MYKDFSLTDTVLYTKTVDCALFHSWSVFSAIPAVPDTHDIYQHDT